MKYTVEGFSQEYALSLKKKVVHKGKEKEIRIDCTDLVILRWFVDFYPSMKKIWVDGREYAWVFYRKILEDLPIIGISTEGCGERFRKLAEFGILDFRLLKENGTFTLYAFGENYMNFVEDNRKGVPVQTGTGSGSNPDRVPVQTGTGSGSNPDGVPVQTGDKDYSIIDTSIKDTSIKKYKKGGSAKETKLDEWITEAIAAYTEDADLKDALTEFAKMRKSVHGKTGALTPYGLNRLLKSLDRLGGVDVRLKVEIVGESIANNWKGFFELDNKRGGKANATNNGSGGGNAAKPEGREWGTVL